MRNRVCVAFSEGQGNERTAFFFLFLLLRRCWAVGHFIFIDRAAKKLTRLGGPAVSTA